MRTLVLPEGLPWATPVALDAIAKKRKEMGFYALGPRPIEDACRRISSVINSFDPAMDNQICYEGMQIVGSTAVSVMELMLLHERHGQPAPTNEMGKRMTQLMEQLNDLTYHFAYTNKSDAMPALTAFRANAAALAALWRPAND